MRISVISLSILFVSLCPMASAGETVICDGAIVSPEMSKGEVLARCGEPSWKETRSEEVFLRISPVEVRKTTIEIEEWYYNPGPNSLIRILRFENGRITEIRTGDYGF